MFRGAYLSGLLVSLGGLLLADRRWRLVWWQDARRAARVLGAGWLLFVLWDAAGIGLHIFYQGASPVLTGLQLAPEFPLEEAFFLLLLVYLPLLLWEGLKRWRHV